MLINYCKNISKKDKKGGLALIIKSWIHSKLSEEFLLISQNTALESVS